MSLAILEWNTWLLYSYSWLYTLHTPLKPLRPIYPHSDSYSFAASILRTKKCPTMSSHAWSGHSYKSKKLRGHDEDSGGVNLTPHNPSKPQSSKTLSAPARQSRKPPSSIDCDKFQELTLQRTSMKLSVQPERIMDNEYENEADDNFHHSLQQPSQLAHHGLKENLPNEDEKASISNYLSDSKPSRRHTSLEEQRIDLEMLKEKNQNLELRHTMKRVGTFFGPAGSSIPMQSRLIKWPKKTRSIIAQTMQTSILFAIRLKVVLKAGPQTKGTKKLSGYLRLRKLIPETTTG